MALEVVNATVPNMVGGSADLTGSNLTKTSGMSVFGKDARGGNYINYGVREHCMTAAMNGLYLHGGILPYGGTFLAFTDYCRSSIQLSALMSLPVTYVMTHDSIGLGEDGPTHQPVEHVASLRAMPNLNVFRPADAVETAECWELAVLSDTTPSILCLSRQGLDTLRTAHSVENQTARGAYVLRAPDGARDVTLIATGGLRTPADFAKAMALGADGVALSNSALQAIGCLGMRACHTNNCPVGIATQKENLRARLEVQLSAARLARLARFFESSVELMQVLARACGHNHLNQFCVDDLTTWKREMADLSGVAYAGVGAV